MVEGAIAGDDEDEGASGGGGACWPGFQKGGLDMAKTIHLAIVALLCVHSHRVHPKLERKRELLGTMALHGLNECLHSRQPGSPAIWR